MLTYREFADHSYELVKGGRLQPTVFWPTQCVAELRRQGSAAFAACEFHSHEPAHVMLGQLKPDDDSWEWHHACLVVTQRQQTNMWQTYFMAFMPYLLWLQKHHDTTPMLGVGLLATKHRHVPYLLHAIGKGQWEAFVEGRDLRVLDLSQYTIRPSSDLCMLYNKSVSLDEFQTAKAAGTLWYNTEDGKLLLLASHRHVHDHLFLDPMTQQARLYSHGMQWRLLKPNSPELVRWLDFCLSDTVYLWDNGRIYVDGMVCHVKGWGTLMQYAPRGKWEPRLRRYFNYPVTNNQQLYHLFKIHNTVAADVRYPVPTFYFDDKNGIPMTDNRDKALHRRLVEYHNRFKECFRPSLEGCL